VTTALDVAAGFGMFLVINATNMQVGLGVCAMCFIVGVLMAPTIALK
jgi:hypothetical protein